MAQNTGGRSPVAIAKALKGTTFPAGKQDLQENARGNQADQATLDVLGQIADRQYQNMADVEKAVGEVE